MAEMWLHNIIVSLVQQEINIIMNTAICFSFSS